MEKARWFVLEQLHPYLMQISAGDVSPNDHKSRLQEVAQALWRKTPNYRVTKETGMSHDRRFTVQVLFDNEVLGEGSGRSKKEAEQAAARDALEVIERARKAREHAYEEMHERT
jgi:ribonuclease-3